MSRICRFCSHPCVTFLHLLCERAGTSLSSQESCMSRLFLGHIEHTGSQQRKLGTTIHAPLNELESVHMPFKRALAPRQRESCKHRSLVLLDPFGKRLQLGHVAPFSRSEPALQVLPRMLSDHLHEPLCQPISGLGTWTSLPDER